MLLRQPTLPSESVANGRVGLVGNASILRRLLVEITDTTYCCRCSYSGLNVQHDRDGSGGGGGVDGICR
jgi:hypothetical protein